MTPFHPKTDAELERLSDDGVIAYVRAAHAAEADEHARHALAILVFGHWANVERRVRMKVPLAYVEDIAMDAITSAVQATFDGESVGEFRVWLTTITNRRIADYYRRRTVETVTLDDEDAQISLPAPSEEGAIEVQDAIERVLERLSDEHRRVVEIVVFEDQPASVATAEIDGLSEDNAYQIARRFRTALKAELEANTDTGGTPDG